MDVFNDTSIRIFWKMLFSLNDILYFFTHKTIYDLMVFFKFLSIDELSSNFKDIFWIRKSDSKNFILYMNMTQW